MTRIVSVWLPHWPIERLKRTAKVNPGWPDRPAPPPENRPFALVEAGERGLTLAAINREAETQGLSVGTRLTDARTIVPDLISTPADREADVRALLALLHWCSRYSPALNIEDREGLWIEIAGSAHLFGGEQALLSDLKTRLMRFGFTSRLGLADTLGAAWALARFSPTIMPSVIKNDQSAFRRSAGSHAEKRDGQSPLPRALESNSRALDLVLKNRIAKPGAQKNAVASLPVAALRLNDDSVHLLKRLGLKKIGQLFDIPRAALKRRFPSKEAAEAVLARLDQLTGVRDEPRESLAPPPAYLARLVFADPLISTEGLEAALEKLCRDLCAQLNKAGQGARRLVFTAYRTDGTCAHQRIGTSTACREAAHLNRLLKEKLQTIDAGFGIDLVTLSAEATEQVLSEQTSLASREKGHPANKRDLAKTDYLIDRLTNRFGAGRVLRLAPYASHIPERAQVFFPALKDQPAWPINGPSTSQRPPFLLAHPEPIQVIAEIPDGPPARFTWRRVTRRIVRAQGPERIAPEWWITCFAHGDSSALTNLGPPRGRANGPPSRSHEREARIGVSDIKKFGKNKKTTRDYYTIEDETSHRYWVFRDGCYGADDGPNTPHWYLHGFFG